MAHRTNAPPAAAASVRARVEHGPDGPAKLHGDDAADDGRKRHDRVVAERAEPRHLPELPKLDRRDRGDPAGGHGSAQRHRGDDERQVEGQNGMAAVALRPRRSKQAKGDPEQETGHAVIGGDMRQAVRGDVGAERKCQRRPGERRDPGDDRRGDIPASAGDVRRRSTRGLRLFDRPPSAEALVRVGVGRDVASIRGTPGTTAGVSLSGVRDRTAPLRLSPHFSLPVASTRKYRAASAVRCGAVGSGTALFGNGCRSASNTGRSDLPGRCPTAGVSGSATGHAEPSG